MHDVQSKGTVDWVEKEHERVRLETLERGDPGLSDAGSKILCGTWFKGGVRERTMHRSKGARGALAAEEKEPLGRGLERTAREKGPKGSFFS